MLVEFRVENHRSLRDEQVFSMEASRLDGEDARPRAVDSSVQLLPAAAIYGANGSGKSNLLGALRFMRSAVVYSHRLWPPDEGVSRVPFAWGPKSREPSLYELTFIHDRVRYQYGFVADDERFLEEWLYVWPNGRKQIWFEREGDDFRFGEHLKGENRLAEKITRANGLFLAAAVQNRHEQLDPIYRWFRRIRFHKVPGAWSRQDEGMEDMSRWLGGNPPQLSLFAANEDAERAARMEAFRSLLQAADLGIIDMKVLADEEASPASRDRQRAPRSRVLLQHRSAVQDAWLPLDEESHGTRQLFRLAPLVLDSLFRGDVLVIDELEASLHPLLALQIIRTFNDPTQNPRNAQLIFSTHDTNLLGNTLGAASLRRDQVWLTEKDAEGATSIYPLTDFKPRKEENLERGYLQGRYGAIPFLGDLANVGKSGKSVE